MASTTNQGPASRLTCIICLSIVSAAPQHRDSRMSNEVCRKDGVQSSKSFSFVQARSKSAGNVDLTFPSFASFVQLHSRDYTSGSQEYSNRQSLYNSRVARAKIHNNAPGRRWNQGVNELWDWTELEMKRLRGRKGRATVSQHPHVPAVGAHLWQRGHGHLLPAEVSWEHLNATRHISRQGSCGSCWAISSTTVLEAHAEIHSKIHRSFSSQELIDCVPNPRECGGQGGCEGATIELAFDYVMSHGLALEQEIPYTAATGKCLINVAATGSPNKALLSPRHSGRREHGHHHIKHHTLHHRTALSFGMRSWQKLPENRYEPLMRALAEKGPVGVSVSADDWYAYMDGIFDACPRDVVIDHAVVLIGYGRDQELSEKFWLLQNSWGTDWGEGGTMRLLRRDSEESHCGIDRDPQQGSGCKGGPEAVKVCGTCGILYDTVVPIFGTPNQDGGSAGRTIW